MQLGLSEIVNYVDKEIGEYPPRDDGENGTLTVQEVRELQRY
jgi:hypothetical protein